MQGGIYLASSVSDSCRAWNCSVDSDVIGTLGDVEQLRGFLPWPGPRLLKLRPGPGVSAVVNVAVAGGVLVADWRKSGFVGFKFECTYAKKNRIEQKRKGWEQMDWAFCSVDGLGLNFCGIFEEKK
jgi:hypothetical protein